MQKILKITFFLLFLSVIVLSAVIYYFYRKDYTLEFTSVENTALMVNGEEVIPSFSKDVKDYHVVSPCL